MNCPHCGLTLHAYGTQRVAELSVMRYMRCANGHSIRFLVVATDIGMGRKKAECGKKENRNG
jgi:hypothetical protein